MNDNNINPSHIVEGGCVGVDRIGRKYAQYNNIPFTTVTPDWNKYGRSAGPIRNSKMVEMVDVGIAIWDGKSRGTKDTIKKMRSANKMVVIHKNIIITQHNVLIYFFTNSFILPCNQD